jgi:hypothetical protein
LIDNIHPYFLALLFSCILIFNGCNSPDEKGKTTSNKDSLSRVVKADKPDSLNSRAMDSFLLHPFDLQKFKKKKGYAQGAGWKGETYFYKPDYKGIYYGFIMFPPAFKGYLGENIKDTVDMENSFELTTYKPLGKYLDSYLDPGEILIELKAKYNDFDLPELAFIGLDTNEVIKRIDVNYFIKDSCMVYTFNNAALILKIDNRNKTEWLKYEKLNANLAKDKIPGGLLKYVE